MRINWLSKLCNRRKSLRLGDIHTIAERDEQEHEETLAEYDSAPKSKMAVDENRLEKIILSLNLPWQIDYSRGGNCYTAEHDGYTFRHRLSNSLCSMREKASRVYINIYAPLVTRQIQEKQEALAEKARIERETRRQEIFAEFVNKLEKKC